MTEKLYYSDCHLRQFTARVEACTPEGEHYRVILDRTAFYPEGGGQAWDTGTLGDAHVLRVSEVGTEILHITDQPLPVGETVEGTIDYARRFDLMQQHSGEHIVSGILHRMFGVHNVGFHMGSDVTTIDFDKEIPLSALNQVEQEANEAVWKNLPVCTAVPSPEELEKAVYRTKKRLAYPVRLVEIPGYDTCACCGVHVKNTGEIGLIKLLSAIRFKQGTRMQLVCGSRALTAMQTVFDQNRLVSQAFSAKIMETGAAAQRMNALLAEEKYRSAGLRRQLFTMQAEHFRDRGNCACLQPGLLPAQVRELADAMAAVCGGAALVVSPGDGAAAFCILCHHRDVTEWGQALLGRFDGHGGGKGGMMQGNLRNFNPKLWETFVEKMNFAL